MKVGIVKKIKMSQLFDKKGKQIPVTQVELVPTEVNQIRTVNRDGYQAVQLKAENDINLCREFRLIGDKEDLKFKKGQKFGVDRLKDVKIVNGTGFSKGKGFQGSIKRHSFSRGPMSHGSHHKRKTGAIGQCVIPSRVFKGKKMPGRMASSRVTIKNLRIVKIEGNNIFIKGSLPGPNGSYLTLRGV